MVHTPHIVALHSVERDIALHSTTKHKAKQVIICVSLFLWALERQ